MLYMSPSEYCSCTVDVLLSCGIFWQSDFFAHIYDILLQELDRLAAWCESYHIIQSQYAIWTCLPCIVYEHIPSMVGRLLAWSLANDFIWDDVVSLALHMSMAFCRVKSGSLRSLLRVLSQWIPHTILSLIKLSLRSLNSHVWALVLISVTYWSIASPLCWLRVLHTCLSHVMFLRGTQYASNFSRI